MVLRARVVSLVGDVDRVILPMQYWLRKVKLFIGDSLLGLFSMRRDRVVDYLWRGQLFHPVFCQ